MGRGGVKGGVRNLINEKKCADRARTGRGRSDKQIHFRNWKGGGKVHKKKRPKSVASLGLEGRKEQLWRRGVRWSEIKKTKKKSELWTHNTQGKKSKRTVKVDGPIARGGRGAAGALSLNGRQKQNSQKRWEADHSSRWSEKASNTNGTTNDLIVLTGEERTLPQGVELSMRPRWRRKTRLGKKLCMPSCTREKTEWSEFY